MGMAQTIRYKKSEIVKELYKNFNENALKVLLNVKSFFQ
jgi:hypothetical protein